MVEFLGRILQYLADVVLCHENISGSKVPVDEVLAGEVLHSQSYLLTEAQQHLRQVRGRHFTWPAKHSMMTIRIILNYMHNKGIVIAVVGMVG